MVIQFEHQITPITCPSDDSEILANVAEHKKSAFRNPKHGHKVCTFYGKTVDTYYRKHGFPPHLQRNSSSTAHNINTVSPDNTNSEQYNLPHKSPLNSTTLWYLFIQASIINKHSNTSFNQVGSSHSTGHSSMVNTCNIYAPSLSDNKSILASQVIDPGASNHICGSLHWFYFYHDINYVHVQLPNGNYSISKQLGTINFTP